MATPMAASSFGTVLKIVMGAPSNIRGERWAKPGQPQGINWTWPDLIFGNS
jgi:hypothetical protein